MKTATSRLKKPPLGIIPIWLWIEINPYPNNYKMFKRKVLLLKAVTRYILHFKRIPNIWMKELFSWRSGIQIIIQNQLI